MSGYIEQSLPFSGAAPLARHCSALGAQDAAKRSGKQLRTYLLLLERRGDEGLTDLEAARLMAIERTSVTARRRPLCVDPDPWIVEGETRPGPTGVRNVCWRLSDAGRAAVRDMREAKQR